MTQVAIQTVKNAAQEPLPVFEEFAKRFDAIQRRAFALFEKRGRLFGHDLDDWLAAERQVLGPAAAELAENEAAYRIQVALPGFGARDVDLTATPEEIVVHAAAQTEARKHGDNVLWTEFGSSEVYRRFATPQPIDAGKVTAELKKGILHVTAPKAPQTEHKPQAAAA